MHFFNKMAILSFLYFIQGMPYGFQSRFLPVYLRKQGQSLTSVSLFKLLLTPWLCKATWAPFLEIFGSRRTWLLLSTSGLALATGCCVFISPDSLKLLCILLFFMNVFAATHDTSVDGMALGLLSEDELSAGNTAQVVGYKLGALFGGGFMLWLADSLSWTGIFTVILSLYVIAIIFIATSTTVSSDAQSPDIDAEQDPSKFAYWSIVNLVFTSPWTKWLMGFLLIYKLAEQGALSMLPLFLVDHGVSVRNIAIWTGVLGQLVSIIGSIFSGYLMSRLSNYRMEPYVLLSRLFVVQFIPLTALYIITLSGPLTNLLLVLSITSMHGLLLISGLVTTAAFTLMMQCSQQAPSHVRATHYSFLATIEIFGKLVFASIMGYLTDLFGYSNMYAFFILLSCCVPIYLCSCPAGLKNLNKRSS